MKQEPIVPSWEETVALRHAPVLLQKVHRRYQRADYITRVDFAHRWPDVHKNWDAVWEKRGAGYRHRLTGHGYYSVVETHTHYFLIYAFYHPQDWSAFWKNPARSDRWQINQHVHDMEGCLAVVSKRSNRLHEQVVALVTISHSDFYSYAGGRYKIEGWAEDVDGAVELTDRFSGLGEPPRRFKLYADSGGHAIRGSKRGWGSESHIVRYRPSTSRAEMPKENGFKKEHDAYFQTIRYKLLSIFEPDGLWAQRDDARVFLPGALGRQAFVERTRDGSVAAGGAHPPWGWDDADDRHQPGDVAWDPARLVSGYFVGLREFSRQYIHNRYIGLVRK